MGLKMQQPKTLSLFFSLDMKKKKKKQTSKKRQSVAEPGVSNWGCR
jgi:hypothetical protein